MDCEFIGPFSEAEQDVIRGAFRAAGGPGRVVSLPRWTVFKDRIGSQCLFLAIDNYRGHTCRGATSPELVDAIQELVSSRA